MPAETLRALRLLETNRGALRKNSTAYRRIASEIRGAANPMTVAKQRLQAAHRVREHEQRQGLLCLAHALCNGHKNRNEGPNTTSLDAVVVELRRGFPEGRLDPQHHQMIERFEARLFAEKVKPDELIDLVERLVKIAVYHPARGWLAYRER
jgi:hypothetical protein